MGKLSKYLALLISFLLSLLLCNKTFATTPHTITVDASLTDWHDDEKLGTSFGQFYFTWDENYFYFAYDR
ncbi:MAG: hypothetical protein RMJ13_04725, partial [Elusimicrobiota bacterium]|nr:hypothetical protein [Elusimicrobiota bacterium]